MLSNLDLNMQNIRRFSLCALSRGSRWGEGVRNVSSEMRIISMQAGRPGATNITESKYSYNTIESKIYA